MAKKENQLKLEIKKAPKQLTERDLEIITGGVIKNRIQQDTCAKIELKGGNGSD